MIILAGITHVLSFPLCGNGLFKPLDSSAFVPDTALPPASMQAGLRRNDGMGKNDSEGCPAVSISLRSFQSCLAIPASRRHSGEGRNPGNEAEAVNRRRVLEDGAFGCRSFGRHSRSAGMDYINHWIPAFAGMTAWARMAARIAPMCLSLCGRSSPILPFPPPVVIPAKAGIQETGPRRLIGAEFSRVACSAVVPLAVIPALREWII